MIGKLSTSSQALRNLMQCGRARGSLSAISQPHSRYYSQEHSPSSACTSTRNQQGDDEQKQGQQQQQQQTTLEPTQFGYRVVSPFAQSARYTSTEPVTPMMNEWDTFPSYYNESSYSGAATVNTLGSTLVSLDYVNNPEEIVEEKGQLYDE